MMNSEIEEQMKRIKRDLDDIQSAILVLKNEYGIEIALLENLRSEETIHLDKGIDKLGTALDRPVRIKDQTIPPITRKEFVWYGIEIKQFPKLIREEYE